MCRYGTNVVLSQMKYFNRWKGQLINMGTLSSSVKDVSPQTVRVIESYFKQKEIQFQHGHTTIIAKCPFCKTASNRLQLTSRDKQESFSLFVNKMTGSHVCNSCGTSGTWSQLKVWCVCGGREREAYAL